MLFFTLITLSAITSNASSFYEELRGEQGPNLRFTLPTQVPKRGEAQKLFKVLEKLHIVHVEQRNNTPGADGKCQLKNNSRSTKTVSSESKR